MPRNDDLRTYILHELRQQFDRAYRPGERLPSQRALASMYGVGQATIHRALRSLAKSGLVRVDGNRGWVFSGGAKAPAFAPRKVRRIGLISALDPDALERHPIACGLVEEARARGVSLLKMGGNRLGRRGGDKSIATELTRLAWNDIDAAILLMIENPLLLQHPLLTRKKTIVVDYDATPYGLDSITLDDRLAGQMAAQHLFNLGHRRFGVTEEVSPAGIAAEQTWLERRHGFEAAIGRLGGRMLPAWKIPVTRNRDREFPGELRRVIAAWGELPAESRPTALFSFEDAYIDEIVRSLAAARIRIPSDISIVGLRWQQPAGGESQPQHTCISLDLETLVRRTLDCAATVDLDSRLEPHRLLAPVLLLAGNSTASPPRK